MLKVYCRAAFAVILAAAIAFFYFYLVANRSGSFLAVNSVNHDNMFELITRHVMLADCDEILAGKRGAIQAAAVAAIPTAAVAQTTTDCQRNILVFPTYPITEFERDCPLAYAISIYKNLNQFLRMFRLIVLQKFGAQRERRKLSL